MKRKSALTATIKRSPRAVQALRPREGASPTQPGQLPGQLLPRRLPLAINLSDAVTREEEPCRQSSALAVSILEHLPNMVFLKEAKELRFVHFNKAGEELLGYSRYDLLGKNDYDLFLNEQAEFFTAKEREVLSGGRLVDIPEELIQTRHKGVRILHTKKIPICDAEGVPQYLLGISEDITERKEVEKILLNTKAELKRRVVQRTAKLLEVNAGLQREIAERQGAEESLRDLGARLIYAQEEERGRIAREIHDDLCQQLALIGVELDQMRQRMRSVAGDEEAALENLLQKVRQVSVDLSGLSHDLHPSKLDHLGLPTAVRSL
ncbi:MAG: PAS domain-containing sensor histidine kinase, partial [Nitrospira sp.]